MAKAKKWFSVAKAPNQKGAGNIQIFNSIGDFGITAQDFAEELAAIGPVGQLNIAISSDGGDVSQGFAIFNMLNRHEARKTVRIEGLAASMASVIAMVGDEVLMPKNAMMMIHNPWGALMGEAEQIKSFGDALAMMQDNIADAYVDRTGIDRTEILDYMAKETWLSAAKAVELKFADAIEQPIQIAASYDLSRFHKVPKTVRDANAKRFNTMTTKANAAAADSSGDSESTTAKTKSKDEVRKEILAHAKEVRSMCALAGKPDLADGFIEADNSLSEVVAALDKAKAKSSTKTAQDEVSGHNDGSGTGKPLATLDTSGVYAKWNKNGARK